MDITKIANIIKTKRKKLGLTQEELASKLHITEKAISRWETARGTPDISLLIPLSKELNIEVSELLNGEENKKEIEQIIEYTELNKKTKYNLQLKFICFLYILSVLVFLIYLRFEYNPLVELNYLLRLLSITIASILIFIANHIYNTNYVEKLAEKNKIKKISILITFIYYIVLIFNMVIFSRYTTINTYNLIPFKTITNILNSNNLYTILINIFGNILIFIPLEYFLIELFKINKPIINIPISFIIILIIEILQYILKLGVFDIDDIILCNLGMIIFYIIYNKVKNNEN